MWESDNIAGSANHIAEAGKKDLLKMETPLAVTACCWKASFQVSLLRFTTTLITILFLCVVTVLCLATLSDGILTAAGKGL